MSAIHDDRFAKAVVAIEELFADKSVSLETTRLSLEKLLDKIEMYIEGVEADISMRDD